MSNACNICENCKNLPVTKIITIISGKRNKKRYRVCEPCSKVVKDWNPRSKVENIDGVQ